MNDQELLDFVEQHLFDKMFSGCEIDDHLGDTPDPAPWAVAFRADTVSRLLDLAKAAHGITGESK